MSLLEFNQLCVPGLELGLLAVYTMVTYLLWRESKFQSQLTISPFLIFEIDNDKFYIRNIGKSHAFNIRLDELILFVSVGDKKKTYRLSSDVINYLGAEQKEELKFRSYSNDKEVDIGLASHLNPEYQINTNYTFNILYSNAIGRDYFTRFRTGKDGLKVLRIKKLSLIQRALMRGGLIVEYLKLKYWQHIS